MRAGEHDLLRKLAPLDLGNHVVRLKRAVRVDGDLDEQPQRTAGTK